MSDAVLELAGVSKVFGAGADRLEIFAGVDLRVEAARKVVITGESGCGKSTLLNIIGGLEAASGGSVRAGPYQIDSLDERGLTAYRRGYLGLVFQFHHLLKDFTALENVMLPAFIAGVPMREATERARSLLVDVNLEHRASHYPSQMSGGERQRAAVARALVNDPALVLADEPTGNLDPANAATVRELLFSVVSARRRALVLVTHDREIALAGDERYRFEGMRLVRQ